MCPVSSALVVTLCPLSNDKRQTVFQLPWLEMMADTALVIVWHLLRSIRIGVGLDAASRWTRIRVTLHQTNWLLCISLDLGRPCPVTGWCCLFRTLLELGTFLEQCLTWWSLAQIQQNAGFSSWTCCRTSCSGWQSPELGKRNLELVMREMRELLLPLCTLQRARSCRADGRFR